MSLPKVIRFTIISHFLSLFHMKQCATFCSVIQTFESFASATDLGKKMFKKEQCVHIYEAAGLKTRNACLEYKCRYKLR